MGKNLVSVIVPIYKVEDAYLVQCIESILAQTYENTEVILVDDGSPDNCGNICDQYAKRDKRIVVIHKMNGGLSDARNAGIEIATGNYISFVDADDYIAPVFLECLVNQMIINNADIVALKSGTDFWENEKEPILNSNIIDIKTSILTEYEAMSVLLYHKIYTGSPFKIYERDIFDSIRFPKGYLYEDMATSYRTFMKAKKIVVVESDLYAYRKRKESIIRQPFSTKKMICLKIADQLIDDISKYDKSLYPAAVSRSYSMIYSVFLQVPRQEIQYQLELWEWLLKYRNIILKDNHKLVRKKNKIAAIVSFGGMKFSYYVGRKFGQRKSFG